MENYSPEFSLDVEGVRGFCPAGEVYAAQQIETKSIPVLSCEGPASEERSRGWQPIS